MSASDTVLFRVKCKSVVGKGISGDIYVRLSFDNYWEHATKPTGKSKEPAWPVELPEFTYSTRQPQRLHTKFFVVEIWEHNTLRKDVLRGAAKLDLYTLFTGPGLMDAQVVAPDHGVIGSVTVEMDTIQVCNPTLQLSDITVETDAVLSGAPSLEAKITAPACVPAAAAMTAEGPCTFSLSSLRTTPFSGSIYDIIPASAALTIKSSTVNGYALLPIFLVYSFSGEPKTFETDIFDVDGSGKIIGTVAGKVSVGDMPQYIQMPGGVRSPTAIAAGVYYLADVPYKPTCRTDLDGRYRGALITPESPPAGATVTSISNTRAKGRLGGGAGAATKAPARPAAISPATVTATPTTTPASITSTTTAVSTAAATVTAGRTSMISPEVDGLAASLAASGIRVVEAGDAATMKGLDKSTLRAIDLAQARHRAEHLEGAVADAVARADNEMERAGQFLQTAAEHIGVERALVERWKAEASDLNARSDKLLLRVLTEEDIAQQLVGVSSRWPQCPEKADAEKHVAVLQNLTASRKNAIQVIKDLAATYDDAISGVATKLSDAESAMQRLSRSIDNLRGYPQQLQDTLASVRSGTATASSALGGGTFDEAIAALQASCARAEAAVQQATDILQRTGNQASAAENLVNQMAEHSASQDSLLDEKRTVLHDAQAQVDSVAASVEAAQGAVERLLQFVPPAPQPTTMRRASAATRRIVLPPCWVRCVDAGTNRVYFQNEITKTTAWALPTELDYDVVWHYPGALGITLVEVPAPEFGPYGKQCELQVCQDSSATAGKEKLAPGHVLRAVNGAAVAGATLDFVQARIREAPRPLTLRFRNPFAVPVEIARAAEDPAVVIDSPHMASPVTPGYPMGHGMPMGPLGSPGSLSPAGMPGGFPFPGFAPGMVPAGAGGMMPMAPGGMMPMGPGGMVSMGPGGMPMPMPGMPGGYPYPGAGHYRTPSGYPHR